MKKKSRKTAKNQGETPDEPTVEDTVEESGGKTDKTDDN
jgi:hypothetical protein